MQIALVLSAEEVQDILNTLGELPTKVGAWPLLMKIKQQAEAYLNAPPPAPVEAAPPASPPLLATGTTSTAIAAPPSESEWKQALDSVVPCVVVLK